MADLVVYTAVFGRPDVLLDPMPALPALDLLCFTDLEFHGESRYCIVPVRLTDRTVRHRQRRVKLFWPSIFDRYEYSLYVDSNMRLKVDPREFIDLLGDKSDLLMFRHLDRDCLYEEARVCADAGLDARDVIEAQVARYRSEGYPEHNGLFAATTLFRRHTPGMRGASAAWLDQVFRYSYRDQISFPYVAWKLGLRVSTFPGDLRDNPWFDWAGHSSDKSPFLPMETTAR